MSRQEKTIGVLLGEGNVTLRIKGSRHVRTARVLGHETDVEGVERIWLDRVALSPPEFDKLEGGWQGTGAVSTVLVRAPRTSGANLQTGSTP